MKLCLNAQDLRKWKELSRIMSENDRILELYAAYLNRMPRFLTGRMVRDLMRDCDLTREQAFRILFGAALGLDIAEKPDDRLLDRHYLYIIASQEYKPRLGQPRIKQMKT